MDVVLVIGWTLFIEVCIWGVAKFREALSKPSRAARLNLS